MNKNFMIGCNYWSSNAGTEMWRLWDEKVIEDDFKRLKEYGAEYLRVFPNWRDFQPINPYLGGGAEVIDYRIHDADLPSNPYYLDETMLERFGTFCDLAEKYGLKLIVGLITGWMSGRSFVPPALYGKKLSTDPVALLFQQKMVTGMVTLFKDKPAIYAWDLGNECNCLVKAENRYEAENWTMIISNAIKKADPSRNVVSGMHSLTLENGWRIADQAENTDILTTHPYPYWCRHCSEAEVTSVQTLMHATCETKYYSNIGEKPCFAEEIGTMGPMICDDETAAGFMKLNLYSNWVNGALGVMWWCANEQIDLKFPPYENKMVEVELGMFDRNGKAKPVLKELKAFSEWLKSTDISLPPAVDDAVCLATATQDQWGVIYSAYVLARQAGVNIRFADAAQELPKAEIYLMPSIKGISVMPAAKFDELKKRVADGATLYISLDNGILSDFNALTGVTVISSKTMPTFGSFELDGKNVNYGRNRNYIISAEKAEVLANDKDGMPIFTKYAYGKGTVYLLNFPLENRMIGVCNAFDGDQHVVYEKIFAETKKAFAVTCGNKYIGMTRHVAEDGTQWFAFLNYSPKAQNIGLSVKDGVEYTVVEGNSEKIEPFGITIIRINKK